MTGLPTHDEQTKVRGDRYLLAAADDVAHILDGGRGWVSGRACSKVMENLLLLSSVVP